MVLGSRVFNAAAPQTHPLRSTRRRCRRRVCRVRRTFDRLDELPDNRYAVLAAHLHKRHNALPGEHRLGKPCLAQPVEEERQVVVQVEALGFDEPADGGLRVPVIYAHRKVAAAVPPGEVGLPRLAGTERAGARRRRRLDHLGRRPVKLGCVHRDVSLGVAAVRRHRHRRPCALQAERRRRTQPRLGCPGCLRPAGLQS